MRIEKRSFWFIETGLRPQNGLILKVYSLVLGLVLKFQYQNSEGKLIYITIMRYYLKPCSKLTG